MKLGQALDAYAREEISAGRLAEVLGCNIADLSVLQSRMGEASLYRFAELASKASPVASPVPDADALTRMANEIATRLVCDCPEMETGDGPRRPFEHFTECRAPRAASEVREYLRVQLSRAPQGG